MKSTVLYSIVVLLIICLLVAAGVLTYQFFGMSTPESHAGIAASAPAVVTESVVDVAPPPPTRTATAEALPFTPPAPAVDASPAIDEASVPVVKADLVPGPSAEVVAIAGVAWATQPGAARRPLELKSILQKADVIETDAGAHLTIRFSDDSEIHVGSGTTMVLDEYVFDAAAPEKSAFSSRLVRGVFRVVTGMIVRASPDRFTVRSKMATIGIRGCHVAFRSTEAGDDIFVLALTDRKTVEVTASKTGKPLMNMLTGQSLVDTGSETETLSLSEPQTMVSLQAGREPEQKGFTEAEARDVIGETVRGPSARYELNQRPDESVLQIQPAAPPVPEGEIK